MMRHVVVAGWGQVTQPKELEGAPRGPLGLMTRASVRAGQTAGSEEVLRHLDGIMVVRIVSRHCPDAAGQLAHRLHASPRLLQVSGIGGHSPQTLVNIAAGMIARGELDSVLVAGAEAYVPRGENPECVDSALFRGVPPDYAGDDLVGVTPLEKAHGIEHPMQGFPLFETALWAASGLDLRSYLKRIGTMWSGFNREAAQHPHAWSKVVRTPEDIITPSKANRPIAFPYGKFMNAFVTVDQGAAVILMSEDMAGRLERTERRTVYFLGGGYAEDRQRFLIEKSDFTVSPPLGAAVNKALARSRMRLEDLDCFDLYSCFPSAVTIGKKMIGISDDDTRPLTLTGGLGFFGGPGNNYNLHAIATLAEKIAGGERDTGLVTALGWFMHKHAAGVYGAFPQKGRFQAGDVEDSNSGPVGDEPVPVRSGVNGVGVIETYTVVYNRDRTHSYAVIYGRTPDGCRFIARAPALPEVFNLLTSRNQVGRRVSIRYDASGGLNIAWFDDAGRGPH
jgi:acetyl-CoA C-acetyltransferase